MKYSEAPIRRVSRVRFDVTNSQHEVEVQLLEKFNASTRLNVTAVCATDPGPFDVSSNCHAQDQSLFCQLNCSSKYLNLTANSFKTVTRVELVSNLSDELLAIGTQLNSSYNVSVDGESLIQADKTEKQKEE